MSEETIEYPRDAGDATFLLTVRGTMAADSLDDACKVHNSTAGADQSVAAARSLGDLSHNVYAGYSEALGRELLFIDFWNSLTGLGMFFSDPHVKSGAGMLFTTVDNPVWARAEDFGSYHLAVPSGRSAAGVGILRATVTSLDTARSAFRAYAGATINKARRHGIVSHSLWARVPEPGGAAIPEVLGLDMWLDPDEMYRYYDLNHGFEHLGPCFAGAPDTSTWRAAPGDWTEW